MEFSVIKTNSAPEMLVNQILEKLRKGDLEPGSRLPSQRELASMSQVGLSSVREAVKILAAMGYLEVTQGKGTFISQDALSRDESPSRLETALEAVSLADLMKAREIMECGAVEMVANMPDEEDFSRIRDALHMIEACAQDEKGFYEADFDFHIAIAEATHNKAIYEIVNFLVDRVHQNHTEFMAKSLKNLLPINIQRSIASAREIYARLTERQGEQAAWCMRDHLNIVGYELESGFFQTLTGE